ncbi:hypothetical protein ACFL5O_02720 [Myxococcota bacterium]
MPNRVVRRSDKIARYDEMSSPATRRKSGGAKTSGAKTSGAKTSGAKTSGAKTSGAKTSGAKTSGPDARKRNGAPRRVPKRNDVEGLGPIEDAALRVPLPQDAHIVGEPVTVTSIRHPDLPRVGLLSTCTRGGRVYEVSLADVVFPAGARARRSLRASVLGLAWKEEQAMTREERWRVRTRLRATTLSLGNRSSSSC